jgi:type VI secretion system FHA domain protein
MLLLELVQGTEGAVDVRTNAKVPAQQARFVIGRGARCDWPIADRQLALSAKHCEIVRIEGRHVLRDLSTNGTFVNGSRKRLATEHVLRHGDRIAIGNYVIVVRFVSDADATSPPEVQPPTAAPARRTRRGDDPALHAPDPPDAAQAADSERQGLGMNSGFTRIAKPWVDTASDGASVFATVPTPRSPDEAASSDDAVVVEPGAPEVFAAVAEGLGLSPKGLAQTLGSDDAVQAAQRVARLLRVAIYALHHQMVLHARQVHALTGKPPQAAAVSERLRTAADAQEAVVALLATRREAEELLVHAHGEIGLHLQHVISAIGTACQRLADQLEPGRIASETTVRDVKDPGAVDPAKLWRSYTTIWKDLGHREGRPWSEGFVAAAETYLCAAYEAALAEDSAKRR